MSTKVFIFGSLTKNNGIMDMDMDMNMDGMVWMVYGIMDLHSWEDTREKFQTSIRACDITRNKGSPKRS